MIPEVLAPFVGHYPFNTCFGGGFDEGGFLVWGCGDGHRDYEDVLALESRHERAVRSVVYVLGGDVGGKDTGAFWAGKSRDGMFAVCE